MPLIHKIIFLCAVAVFLASIAQLAEASLQCGVRPLPPIGCTVAQCQCDEYGCRWVFTCD